MLILLLVIAALVCFGIPMLRALLASSFDYTNSGLFCLTLTYLLGLI